MLRSLVKRKVYENNRQSTSIAYLWEFSEVYTKNPDKGADRKVDKLIKSESRRFEHVK